MKKNLILLLSFAVFSCAKNEPIPVDDFMYFDEIKGQYNGHAVMTASGKNFILPYESITTKIVIKRNQYEMPYFEITEYDYSTVVITFKVIPFASTEKLITTLLKILK